MPEMGVMAVMLKIITLSAPPTPHPRGDLQLCAGSNKETPVFACVPVRFARAYTPKLLSHPPHPKP